MTKLICAIVAAALLGGAGLVVIGFSGAVAASPPPTSTKADRLDARPTGTACSQRGWPHFELACLRNTVSPTRDVRPVRIISTDRLADAGSLRGR